MKNLKIYLDTSILNFMYAEDVPDKMMITKKFFKEIKIKTFHSFISEVVVDEINKTPEPKKTKLSNLIKKFNLGILSLDPRCERLAEEYLRYKLIPSRYRNDAIHIAIATVNEVDVLVSWNLEHMVKLKTVRGVNLINKKLGYKQIDIRTPEEVIL